ncbi:hypothetical protein BDZ90DRAFT_38062 [Jaminaea rosea]|uniref:Proteasome assembly chaperone 1 n=1 Tax=Jaminaea rosea TaxID=1569628 RepID=A0A316UMB9_9BASI|nr:hypothetical protein BDZ90DRAFT_38062 [Jaminaea rosea]PWN26399.1 hypothetical protein BDZ90DRAFT_38062 [Jaminaea rosea]
MDSLSLYDPVNRLDVPPSRHAVESDSESDSGDDLDDIDDERQEEDVVSQHLEMEGNLDALRGKDLIILVGQVGETIVSSLKGEEGWARMVCTVKWQGRVQASFSEGGVGLVYPSSLLMERPGIMSLVMAEMLKRLKPKSLCILTSYSPVLYIDPSPPKQDHTSSIRYLSSRHIASASSLHAFSPPNFLWGADAALTQSAVYACIPTLVLLAPNNSPSLRPQARIAPDHKGDVGGVGGGRPMGLDEVLESDEDEEEDGSTGVEEADPMPLSLDEDERMELVEGLREGLRQMAWPATLPLLPVANQGSNSSSSSEGTSLAHFVQERRREAVRRRQRNASGMYV